MSTSRMAKCHIRNRESQPDYFLVLLGDHHRVEYPHEGVAGGFFGGEGGEREGEGFVAAVAAAFPELLQAVHASGQDHRQGVGRAGLAAMPDGVEDDDRPSIKEKSEEGAGEGVTFHLE